MRKALTNNVEYFIPQSWEDLTYDQAIKYYLARVNTIPANESLFLLTGIPPEVIDSLSENSVSKLFDELVFTNDESIYDRQDPKPEYKDLDYGSLPYGKTEKIRQMSSESTAAIDVMPDVIKLIYGIDMRYESFTEWIGTANFFLNKWLSFTIHSSIYQMEIIQANKNKLELEGSKDSETLVLT